MNRKVDMLARQRPYDSIMHAIRRTSGIIVEIGCMRQPLCHYPDESHHECCLDGHSTYLFARTGRPVHSVDISDDAILCAASAVSGHGNVKLWKADGISFLGAFVHDIGLLYLDGWDLDKPDSAEKHLEAFRAAEHLNPQAVLIDDTDLDWDGKDFIPALKDHAGKGRLLIPWAIDIGYSVEWTGRQTFLVKSS